MNSATRRFCFSKTSHITVTTEVNATLCKRFNKIEPRMNERNGKIEVGMKSFSLKKLEKRIWEKNFSASYYKMFNLP